MAPDFRTITERIIHRHFTNYRRKVRKALEEAYMAGVDDAAAEVEALSRDLPHRVRAALANRRHAQQMPLPEAIASVRASLQ